MNDSLTQSVLDYQAGTIAIEPLRNLVIVEAYTHLVKYRRKGEDEVSEFLLGFYDRVEGLVSRFRPQGLPFRHYLLRSLRWQWHTFRTARARERRQTYVVSSVGLGAPPEAEQLAESTPDWGPIAEFSDAERKRLVLLALKAAPWLDDQHIEALSEQTGADLAWLQACQHQIRMTTDRRRHRLALLGEKRSEAYYRRLMAEDDAQREIDPERRSLYERRASRYRRRLANLSREQATLSTAPTHGELANLLGMPKGSVDSGLYHLKKKLTSVYSDPHDDLVAGDEQPSQKSGI